MEDADLVASLKRNLALIEADHSRAYQHAVIHGLLRLLAERGGFAAGDRLRVLGWAVDWLETPDAAALFPNELRRGRARAALRDAMSGGTG